MAKKAVRKVSIVKKSGEKAKKAEYELLYVNHSENNVTRIICSNSDENAKRNVKKFIVASRRYWKNDHIKAIRLVKLIPMW